MICFTPANCVLMACESDVGAAVFACRAKRAETPVTCKTATVCTRLQFLSTPVVQHCWTALAWAVRSGCCWEPACVCCAHQMLCCHPAFLDLAAGTNPRQELLALERLSAARNQQELPAHSSNTCWSCPFICLSARMAQVQ